MEDGAVNGCKVGRLRSRRPLRRDFSENEDGARRDQNTRKEGGKKRLFCRLPRLGENGNCEEEVHSRIQAPAEKAEAAEKSPPAPARKKDEAEEDGHQNGVEDPQPFRPPAENEEDGGKPRKGEEGRKAREEGIQPREHAGGGDKGAEKKGGAHRSFPPSEECRERGAVSAVLFPEPQKEGAEQRIKERGEKHRDKVALRAEETDKLRARDKSRADTRPHDKKRRPYDPHSLLFTGNPPAICEKIKKFFQIMSDIVLFLLTYSTRYCII